MPDPGAHPLRIVDGLTLDAEHRAVLRPGELMEGPDGVRHRLPRWFFEVPSWEVALETSLTPHFAVWEFLDVDMREHPLQRAHVPRYLPLAAGLLATALEVLRAQVDTYVHISTNGGYRTPAHRLSGHANAHCWGAAANLYRIGDDYLDDDRTIHRYGQLIRRVNPALRVHPYGHGPGETDDHLHVDIGYAVVTPRGGDDGDP